MGPLHPTKRTRRGDSTNQRPRAYTRKIERVGKRKKKKKRKKRRKKKKKREKE